MSGKHTQDIYRQVAGLHVENLNKGFLSTLGEGFLTLMYHAIDHADGSVLLVEIDGTTVSGFVSGTGGMKRIYGQMLRHPIRLGLALLPSVFSLGFYKRCIEIFQYGNADMSDLPDEELLSIVVAPQYRGKKVSENLYSRLREHFSHAGVKAFKIMVGKELNTAHRFYQRMGAQPVGEYELHEGAKSVLYVQQV